MAPSTPGTYTYTINYSNSVGSPDITGNTSAVFTRTVPAQAEVTGSFTAANKVYDGTTAATITSRNLTGVAAGDDVSLASGTASFDDKNIGTGKTVTGMGFTLAGDDAGKYKLASTTLTTTANITAKALTVSGLSAQSKVYDGNTNATITGTPQLQGVISPDNVSLSGTTASGTFNNANVGNDKPVTVSGLSLTGNDAGNYSLTQPELSANITAWDAQGRGFYQPVGVNNSVFVPSTGPNPVLPTAKPDTVWNTAKGGQTIPLKFNLFAGNVEKTSTSDISGFRADKVSCPNVAVADEEPVEFVTSGNTSLRYDTTDKQFIQNWQTPKVNAETCYRATATFADGSTLSAFFKLKK